MDRCLYQQEEILSQRSRLAPYGICYVFVDRAANRMEELETMNELEGFGTDFIRTKDQAELEGLRKKVEELEV